jgi:tRNA-modifying protein YgfZ
LDVQVTVSSSALLFDLSARTKLRVAGADRLRYLNGQISNDVRRATEERAVHACVLSAKGKIQAEVFICSGGESFLIDSDAELREALATRLERYVIADDVQITDATDEFALLHLMRETPPQISNGRVVAAERFGSTGWDIWLPAAAGEAALHLLKERVEFCDPDCAEVLRIERGIPRWGAELSEEILPPEVALEPSTIDYAKGCYIGQEVISRMKMSGQTSKRLCGLKPTAAAAKLLPGSRLFTNDEERREVGSITSVAFSERLQQQIALGFLKRGFQEPGSTFVTDAGAAVTVVPLPFVEKH